ncbi:MAG: DUF4156 domain-containing protein [Mariprofundus sp.]
MKKFTGLLIMTMAILTGCTWVETTDKARDVRVVYMSQVEGCKQLGRATVSVLDHVAFIPRSEEQVSEELEILGRNAASEMDGDAVVAMSKIIEGEQVFNVYRCK